MQLGSVTLLIGELNAKGHRTKSWTTVKGVCREGVRWNKGHVYRLLNNPLYIGRVRHREKTYPGEHEAVIESSLWNEVHGVLSSNNRSCSSRNRTPAMLKGVIRCGHCGSSMGITYTRKGNRCYRYYLCTKAGKNGYGACPVRTVPAGDIENAVLLQLRKVLRMPEIVAKTHRLVKKSEEDEKKRLMEKLEEHDREIRTLESNVSRLLKSSLGDNGGLSFVERELAAMEEEIENFKRRRAMVSAELNLLEDSPSGEADITREIDVLDNIWDGLFPAEKGRIIGLLVDSVTVHPDGLDLVLKADGLWGVAMEINGGGHE